MDRFVHAEGSQLDFSETLGTNATGNAAFPSDPLERPQRSITMEQSEQFKEGLEKLGKFMGVHPGLAIVRQHSALNMWNILVMQAEIANFELEWEGVMKGERESGMNQRCSVWNMKRANNSKWKKTLELRKLLKEYSQYIIHCHFRYPINATGVSTHITRQCRAATETAERTRIC
jgi:hypothetical protein